jgi:hypothetical protein
MFMLLYLWRPCPGVYVYERQSIGGGIDFTLLGLGAMKFSVRPRIGMLRWGG